jgi:hypothetical protein
LCRFWNGLLLRHERLYTGFHKDPSCRSRLAAVFAAVKPGYLDQAGAAALKDFLNFGGKIAPEREATFNELRTKFSAK